MKSVILLGIKHCGKSSQSVLLGKKLDLDTYDTDQVIVDMTGKSAREIYTESGEEAFKAAEAAACTFVSDKIAGCGRSAVIATGGGICMNPAALQILRPLGTFVFLCAKEDIASERIVREIKIDAEGNLCNLPAYIAKRNREAHKGRYYPPFFEQCCRFRQAAKAQAIREYQAHHKEYPPFFYRLRLQHIQQDI